MHNRTFHVYFWSAQSDWLLCTKIASITTCIATHLQHNLELHNHSKISAHTPQRQYIFHLWLFAKNRLPMRPCIGAAQLLHRLWWPPRQTAPWTYSAQHAHASLQYNRILHRRRTIIAPPLTASAIDCSMVCFCTNMDSGTGTNTRDCDTKPVV